MTRNVFLYWVGNEYKLISILRNLIYLHSKNGRGYNVILITDKNINEYVKNIPDYFNKLIPALQADFVRVNVICDYGGIWLDSDTLVMSSLDSLFDYIENDNGFFMKENNQVLVNGIFGSKPNTDLMIEWKRNLLEKMDLMKEKVGWGDIASKMLEMIYATKPDLYKNYKIFNGLDNIYPVNWLNCVKEFIEAPYDNYENIIREYQPLIVLVNSVYKAVENKSIHELLYGNMPLNYFIRKSFENLQSIDYDFIEIGTSNFDTLIQAANDKTKGLSVEMLKYYIDCLPDKENVKKLNLGISNVNTYVDVYYIPEEIIISNGLPDWFKGCNRLNGYHPLHIKYGITHLCKIEKVKVITTTELFYQNRVRKVKYLKIDTEGHDCIILKNLFSYLKFLPKHYYPSKIQFESNENSTSKDVDEIIQLYISIDYTLQSRGYDTVLIINNS